MHIRPTISLLTAITLSATWCSRGVGAEIYRWVGEDGVVHYSDTKPRDDEGFTTLDIPDTRPQGYDPTEDPYSIINQARRLNEAWSELEKTREEREERRLEQAQNELAAAPLYDPYAYDPYAYDPLVYDRGYYYAPAWPAYPGYRDYRGYRGMPARQQARAAAELELVGPRPYSINSSAHQERVVRSQFLPLVPPARPPHVQHR